VNPSTVLAALAVDALAAAGIRQVVLCPGSRSAPLAYELARRQVPGAGTAHPGGDHPGSSVPGLHVRHDERVAGFVALGVGADRAPGVGAVVTTSGTAAANLMPAALEAHHANVPLVLLTADRPARLRGTWANQTSELQAGIFARVVRAALDLADDEAVRDPAGARQALDRTLRAALGLDGGRPGPVHLNLGFEDPLVPDDSPQVAGPARPGGDLSTAPVRAPGPTVPPLPDGPRTVVLAGDGAGPGAQSLAEQAGWPLLAEPSSGARGGPNAVGPYRLLFELPELGGRVERVVAFGRPTLSRPVTRLLARDDVEVVLVSPYPEWPEPGRPVRRLPAPPWPAGLGPLSGRDRHPPIAADDWLAAWRAAGAAASTALDRVLERQPAITGPLLAREVVVGGGGDLLLAGASNPIRDLDLASPVGASGQVHANRGLSGIDGTVSTAIGMALGGGRVRVLVGDLTFLHDVGALLLGPGERRPDVQVVVLNDSGGGIFSLLEYGERALRGAAEAALFERVFGTPQSADLAALCRGYGVDHRRADDVEALRKALADPPPGLSVVEVRADRAGLRELHAAIRTAVHAAARAALAGLSPG
jgi:2-succinyl-5-enolpyruvyl-6-hydroxy-3-cyclohexene-1-carboxylate synthase